MRRFFQLLAIAGIWFAAFAAAAHADKRVALVIGNADYENVAALSNPVNDATAIGTALTRLGFTVRNQSDLGFDAMRRTLSDFARETAGADIAVIYYAGHGMEFDGQNYLIPVDARLGTDLDVLYETISISLALSALEGARGTRLLILDACRNNPFMTSMRVASKSRALGRGLARVEPSVGTIVAYAAKEGTIADDGDGEHSPFAAALLEHIEEPGIDIQFLFRKVRDTVLEATNGNQEPFTYGSLPGKSVLLSPEKPVPPPAPAATVSRSTESGSSGALAAEVAFWNTIEDTGDRALYESYLKQFPDGAFASLARIFIDRIDSEAAAKAAVKEPPPAAVADAPVAPLPAPIPAPAPAPVIQAVTPSPPAPEPAPAPTVVSAPEPPAPVADPKPIAVGPVASLAPEPLPPVAKAKPDREFIRDVQEELVRVGCGTGRSDGVWGKKSRTAAESFVKFANITLASLDPSADLLSALKQQTGRVCPLVCGARFDAIGDNCVLKTCPSGEKLGSDGGCFKPPEAKQPATKNASKATGGSRCRVESVMQCIDRKTRARGQGRSAPTGAVFGPECNNPERRLRVCR